MLANYVSEKIIDIEGKKKGIQLSDSSLKNILIVDKNFHKDKKFSRTKYEKFLLENGYSATTYERYLKSIEIKEIEFLNLNQIYSKKIISKNEIQKFYDDNKESFKDKFVSFKYLELKPEYLTGKKDFDEEYYQKLDVIENDVLDGKRFEEIIIKNEKNIKKVNLVNSRKTKEDGTVLKEINTNLFQKIFLIQDLNVVQFINANKKYFIVEITDSRDINLTLKDNDLKNTLEAQLKTQYKANENKKLSDRIFNKKFTKDDFLKFSEENNLIVNKIKINGIDDTKKFKEDQLKKIFDHGINEMFVMSDNIVQDNFIIRVVKDTKPTIDYKSDEYKKYYEKANASYIAKVYKSYDRYINTNYKIDINEKVLERLKNSF